MLTATVLALAPMMILAQTNYADYPLTQDALNKYCGGLTTPAQKCIKSPRFHKRPVLTLSFVA